MLYCILFQGIRAWEWCGKNIDLRKREPLRHVVLMSLERWCRCPQMPHRLLSVSGWRTWDAACSQTCRCFIASQAECYVWIPCPLSYLWHSSPLSSPRSQSARPAIPTGLSLLACFPPLLYLSSPQCSRPFFRWILPQGLHWILFLFPDLLHRTTHFVLPCSILGVNYVTVQLPDKAVKVLKLGIISYIFLLSLMPSLVNRCSGTLHL